MLDMSIAILNLLQDVVVVVLPMPVLWGLQMATTRKVALSCMFGMGIMYASSNGPAPRSFQAKETDAFIAVGSVPSQSTASK